jgi:hypothetical protein
MGDVRPPLRIVGAAALAGAIGACGVITGLGSYSTGACTEGCDASVGRPDTSMGMLPDEGVAATDAPAGDDAGDGGSEGDGEGGCGVGLLACEAGCVNPSLPATCGSCANDCGGDASMCASDLDGSYACTSTCPATSPTACSGSCVDTTSNADNCMTCGNACTTAFAIANATPACVSSACTFACNSGYTSCVGGCVNFLTDSNNCGGCGAAHACTASQACVGGVCQAEAPDSGSGGVDAGQDSGSGGGDGGPVACPAGGCPMSTASGFSCPTLGHCNGTTSECSAAGGCFCSNDTQCPSQKCVKVTGENDVSCGTCTGTGSRDGYNCQLSSPGIPVPSGTTTYACPANAGYKNSPLTCDTTDTNCYCTADSQCPSGKCIPSAAHATCTSCTGTGTADYRGCETIATIPGCPIYIGCPANTLCSYPTCYCTSDVACDSGHCIPSSHNGNCSGCTGTGSDDGHGCMPAPSSIACAGTGGTSCTTSLTPAPVLNAGKTACMCVADGDCSSGKCVNASNRCTGSCTGTGTADAEGCETATSVANAWSCSAGNCDTVSSSSGMCTSAGVPCWCTSDSQCPTGAMCSSWAGCAAGQCSGSGTGNGFNCVP